MHADRGVGALETRSERSFYSLEEGDSLQTAHQTPAMSENRSTQSGGRKRRSVNFITASGHSGASAHGEPPDIEAGAGAASAPRRAQGSHYVDAAEAAEQGGGVQVFRRGPGGELITVAGGSGGLGGNNDGCCTHMLRCLGKAAQCVCCCGYGIICCKKRNGSAGGAGAAAGGGSEGAARSSMQEALMQV